MSSPEDRFRVIGKAKVAIHVNTRSYAPGQKPYYFFSLGDTYNMQTRQLEK